MTTTREQKIAKGKALIAAQPTRILVGTLLELRTKPDDSLSAEERLVHAWVCEALEERYPKASEALDTAFAEFETAVEAAPDGTDPAQFDFDFDAVLIANIPAEDLA
ncbi:hypothetical protein [Amycolatopsis sp. DSM 110486]|uniref:hypothetical protein n=1 Tax=Amycolatopsis sp. DSM 110486 TaxID=2865832 RepID=UPI001C697C5A|nr:hypothetical protein [Amycolatopsis sp. DSM 110486]QYN17514.1 hypothetical protein K1T34_32530 [Amycolatopsis sp. DSM 110486]